nr:uncharacterized protein LOC101247227 isoform X2 [Solanum lycopersicum]
MGAITLSCFVNSIGGEAPNSSNALPSKPKLSPLLSFSKPSWVVRTESNVRKERRKQPDPPCVVCKGNGRVECYHCHGRGRTNFLDLEMLPRGEWPKCLNQTAPGRASNCGMMYQEEQASSST